MTFQAGRYYFPNGVITVAASSAFSATSLTTGIPIYIPNAITLQTLSCETAGTITGTAHARMALYTDAGGTPGVPVAGTDTGDLTQTAAGVLTSSTLGVSLSPGWYWPVFETSGLAGGTIYAATVERPAINTQAGANTPAALSGGFRNLLATHTYGNALPSPWSTTSESGVVTMPVIALGF
jgi:hypothetical protein